MKFADEYFDEIKPGTILINIDDTDDEFTKGAEYEIHQDEEGLFLVDDCGYEELFNLTLAQYFIIKEPEITKFLEKLEQWEAKLIVTDECWKNGLPQLNQNLYEQWLELQQDRNMLLGR